MRPIREKLQLVLLILSIPFVVILCTFASWLSIILATIERLVNPVPNPEEEPPTKQSESPVSKAS